MPVFFLFFEILKDCVLIPPVFASLVFATEKKCVMNVDQPQMTY